MQTEFLYLIRVYKDGSVLATHTWQTGRQALVFRSAAAFNHAADALKAGGRIL